MSISNIAIVFGPTLFGLPTANPAAGQPMQVNGMADAAYQNKVRPSPRDIPTTFVFALSDDVSQAIETILEHYTDIFIDENDES